MENQSLLHADDIALLSEDGGLGSDDAVFPRRLPVAGLRGPLRPEPVRVLPVLWREEEPLGIIRLDQRLICAANQIFRANSTIRLQNSGKPKGRYRGDPRVHTCRRQSRE